MAVTATVSCASASWPSRRTVARSSSPSLRSLGVGGWVRGWVGGWVGVGGGRGASRGQVKVEWGVRT
jgi:hypothetical protein